MKSQGSKLEQVIVAEGWWIGRVFCLEQAKPYFGEVVRVINILLPPAYPRVSLEELTKERHLLPDGRWVDFRETWQGHSFLIFYQDRLVGVSLGRREVVLDEVDSGHFTGRGFVPYIVATNELQGSPKVTLLALPLKSLVEAGAKEIRGSCSPANTLVEKLCSRFASQRWLDGEWVRYSVTPDGVERLFNIVVRSQRLTAEMVERLVGHRD